MEKPRKKIILLDDDSFLLDMYSMKFKKSGYDVFSFNDSQACIDKLREGFNPDIIVSDLVMPAIDGIGFLKNIREQGLAGHATLIVLSNQGEQEYIDKAKAYDISGYIIKALSTPSEVVEKVEEIYNKKHK